jgi:hypothetical protein
MDGVALVLHQTAVPAGCWCDPATARCYGKLVDATMQTNKTVKL